MRNLMRVALASGALLVAFAGQAQAATTVGQTAPTSAATANCVGPNTFVTPNYTVPADGVLTSWSMQGAVADPEGDDQFKLKILEPLGGDEYLVVAEDPIARTLTPGTLNTFQVRIPVEAGQLIAIWQPGDGAPCAFTAPGAGGVNWDAEQVEFGVGTKFTAPYKNNGDQLNLSANLEPDADRDGFGDETQDQCPTDATTQGACPPPPPPPLTADCQGTTVNKTDGTEGNDTLVGTPAPDAIFGFGGDDDLDGVDDNDCLDGGDGEDILRGGAGNDLEAGGEGKDKVRGQGGKDKLKGQDDDDRLNGGEGKDKLVGGDGEDKLRGAAAKDTYKGNAGDDDLNAVDAKTDKVNCGGGEDKAVVDPVDKVSRNCETVKVVEKE